MYNTEALSQQTIASQSPAPPPPQHGYHDNNNDNEKYYSGNANNTHHHKVEQQQQDPEAAVVVEQQQQALPKKRHFTERNRCCRCLCCACCLPVWARYLMWFIIIGIIICIIVIGALLGSFVKNMPVVNVLDVTESPGDNSSQITFDGTKFMFNLGLIVNVENPNALPIYLSDMQATANMPTDSGDAYLGRGYLDQEKIPSNSDYNFTYPFAIEYDTQSSTSQLMLNTLLEKCGLTGSEAEDITVNYSINVNARVLFVKLNLDLGGSTTFGCPLTVSCLFWFLLPLIRWANGVCVCV
ncbi:hypothetical protein BDB00DRAFT_819630 [Zychaea mexicana]|uniref:uncharacterized protein n=1 Tax=Zychaea mexicana TaxID=64656 RepID=UPI0022FDF0A7|nr:uncharacterized protein BDB00DRAFT_819630 [Zychaea mexicana]KAI9494301.1 hypothetical protein BDB00DRAFT_819630 [Zychaea mexicana]